MIKSLVKLAKDFIEMLSRLVERIFNPGYHLTLDKLMEDMLCKISESQGISKARVIRNALITYNCVLEELSKNEEYDLAIVDGKDEIYKKILLMDR